MLLGQYSTPISLFRATLAVPRSSRTHRRPLGPHQARYWPRIVAHGKRLWCPPPGPPMTLGNRRERRCITRSRSASNDASGLLDVSGYPDVIEVLRDCRQYTHRRIKKICLTSEHSIGMSGHSWIPPLTVHVCSTGQTLRTRCQSRLRTRHMLSPSPAPPPTRRPSSRSKCRMPPQALPHVTSTARACPASKTSASAAMAARCLLGPSLIRLLHAKLAG